MNEPAQLSYLRYLPAVFAKSDAGFLGHYLKIFQKLLSGLNDDTLDRRRGIQELLAAGVVGNLFYSRFSFLFPADDQAFIPPISGLPTPERDEILTEFNRYIGVPAPHNPLQGHVAAAGAGANDGLADFTAWLNEFLSWLASWVDLVLDQAWELDKKRRVIAEIMALYRLRGTAQGMSMLLNLLLDLPMTTVPCYVPGSVTPSPTGTLSVNVLNPTPPAIKVNGQAGAPGTFTLRCAYQPGMPLVSGYAPWLFLVQVCLPAYADPTLVLAPAGVQQVQTLLAQLTTLLDALKPAASSYQLQILGGMCLQAYPSDPPVQPAQPNPPQLSVNAVLSTQMPSP
ncbi:phage tail protein [Dyella subtropica]|uniref:phage tail protein n=1 Tax=Dyella subtropica TaxID=2992127 RepID=UPI002252987C|nr:phage tail protein [Dyella subtropica]